MPGVHARTGNHQVTGAYGTEDTFPGNREPGVPGEIPAAADDDQFSDRSGAGQVFEPAPVRFPLRPEPGKSEKEEQERDKDKKPA